MTAKEAKAIIETDALDFFCQEYGLSRKSLVPASRHEGWANYVYQHKHNPPSYLRISFRPDRTPEMIAEELRFVAYMAENGAPCVAPWHTLGGELCAQYRCEDIVLVAALFTEAPGKFMHHMQYRMPPGVSLPKFWQKQGEVVGKLHALSAKYTPAIEPVRFNWIDRHDESLPRLLPDGQEKQQQILHECLARLREIPPTRQNHGLCHNDLGIINFKLDYSTDSCAITVFDFDDCGYNYFMYDLACLWEINTGWAYNLEPRDRWKDFMDRYYHTMLDEYYRHHDPGLDPIANLPLYLRAVHIENILEPLRDLIKLGKPLRYDREMKYHLYCLENNIENLGLFSETFDIRKPYSL